MSKYAIRASLLLTQPPFTLQRLYVFNRPQPSNSPGPAPALTIAVIDTSDLAAKAGQGVKINP
jgi:hypothetical protein